MAMYCYSSFEEVLYHETSSNSQDFWSDYSKSSSDPKSSPPKKPLREKNCPGKNSGYKHVPHSEKPPQVVARRNARERRRVQAVNNAFVKLRNIVPIHNSRGKRISKVKTLLYAIDYIRNLDNVLRQCGSYSTSFDMGQYGIQNQMICDQRETWNFEEVCTAGNKYF